MDKIKTIILAPFGLICLIIAVPFIIIKYTIFGVIDLCALIIMTPFYLLFNLSALSKNPKIFFRNFLAKAPMLGEGLRFKIADEEEIAYLKSLTPEELEKSLQQATVSENIRSSIKKINDELFWEKCNHLGRYKDKK